MVKPTLQQKIKNDAVPLLKKEGVIRAGLFGSYARGDATAKSDVDLLVKFKGKKSLLQLAGLELALEKKLKRKVDLLTYNSINPLLRERILREEVKLI